VAPLLEAQGNLGEEHLLNGQEEQFLDADGNPEATLADVLELIYREIQGNLEPGLNTGTAELDRVRHVRFGEGLGRGPRIRLEVERLDWTQTWTYEDRRGYRGARTEDARRRDQAGDLRARGRGLGVRLRR